MKTEYIVIYMTAAGRDEAEKIARRLVEEKLVACANIVADIHSVYWWQGTIESAPEVFVMFKTRASLFDAAAARIRELHSYKVPEIIAVPVVRGHAAYLSWIGESTAGDKQAAP